MPHYTQTATMTPEMLAERDEFVRSNAVAVVADLEAKVNRQTENITRLGKTISSQKGLCPRSRVFPSIVGQLHGLLGQTAILRRKPRFDHRECRELIHHDHSRPFT